MHVGRRPRRTAYILDHRDVFALAPICDHQDSSMPDGTVSLLTTLKQFVGVSDAWFWFAGQRTEFHQALEERRMAVGGIGHGPAS